MAYEVARHFVFAGIKTSVATEVMCTFWESNLAEGEMLTVRCSMIMQLDFVYMYPLVI